MLIFSINALSSLSRGVSVTPQIKKSSVVFKDTATSTSRSIEAAHSPLSILPKWRSLMFSFMANCSCVSPWALRCLLDTFAGGVRIKVHKPALRPNGAATNRHPRGQSAGRHSFAAGRLLAGTGFVLNQSPFHSFSSSFPLSMMAMLWGGAWRMHGAILHDSKRENPCCYP